MKSQTKAKQEPRPTYAELKDQRDTLRSKVQLLQRHLMGKAAHLDLMNACGVTGDDSQEVRKAKAGVFRGCALDLDYVLQGER